MSNDHIPPVNNNEGVELPDVSLVNEELIFITAEKLLTDAGDNVARQAEAINQICQSLFDLHDTVMEEHYVTHLAKRFKLTKKIFNDKLKTLRESSKETDEEMNCEYPDGVDTDLAKRTGFFEHRGKYYFITKDGLYRASNFIMRPLLHIYSKTDNKRLIEITNEHNYKRILELPSKNFVSVEQFQAAVYAEGNYIFFGNKVHFMKIVERISSDFPTANELKTLGWQREGFYAFANGIFNGKWQPTDELGITEHKKSKYYSPSFSAVYNDVREDDDEYEDDRYFIWQDNQVAFGTWTKLMKDVYGEKAIIAIAFLIASVFRDLIYEKYKIFPHLFLFGEKQSGKSQLAWSLSNVFFNNLPAFNLNSGTQVGFFRRLSRVKNCICWFDEYTNDIDEKRFQALKSAYDGMGHEKGKMTKDSRTEITKVNSSCVISGQYLPTRDDNALFTRSILLSFERKKYTDQEIRLYDQLKDLELKGLSSLIGSILKYREDVDKAYGMTFSSILEHLKDDLVTNNKAFDERLLRNFVSILTPVNIIMNTTDPLDFNFTWERILDMAGEMISALSTQISSSEAVASFWNMVEFMLDSGLIKENVDFKIRNIGDRQKLIDKNGKHIEINFEDQPQELLFIRFSKIHPLYMEAHRRQYGKNGVDQVSIVHYFKHHVAFMGTIESTRFDNTNTSAFVFKYKELGCNLIRTISGQNEGENPDKNTSSSSPSDDLPF
jgi:DNA primase